MIRKKITLFFVCMLSLMAVTQAYAQGDINVTFFRDYGDEEGATEQYFESGVEKVLRTNTFTRAGYHFLNWSDDGGVTYSDGQLVTFINDMGDGSTVSVILYAQWGKNRYTVTFAGEGVNEATFPEIKLEALNTGTVPATVPTRTGYVFKGWSGSDGKSYQPGDLLKNPNDYSDGSLTLTAQWAAEIAVKFDINGADGTVPEHIKGEANGSISLPKADGLSLTGHTFAGWKTAGDETLYASGATFTLPSASTPTEITFTAQWTPNKYKVKFDRNGSLLGKDMSDQNFIYGKQQRLSPNQYDKLAHDFGGWNTDKDGKGTAYTDNQEVLNLTDQNGATVTLYAQWKYRSYTIKYDPNGALGSIADMTVAKDEEVALSDGTGYTRKGYTLSNWNMAADGTGTSYTPGQTVKNINGKNDVVTLYAQWTPNKYTIVFDPNPKEGDEDKISGGPMGTLNMTYDEEDRYLPENIFKYEGHTFDFWHIKPIADDGDADDGGYDSRDPIMNLTDVPNGKVTLYARWQENKYFIIYNSNADDATGTMTSQLMTYGQTGIIAENAYTRAGYTFLYWSTDPLKTDKLYNGGDEVKDLMNEAAGEYNLYAHWQPSEYKVQYMPNGGEGSMDVQNFTYGVSQPLTTNAFTRTGYTFIGWNSKADGTGNSYTPGATVENLTTVNDTTIDLYAQWQANTYYVKFDKNSNSATGSMPNQKLFYGTPAALDACIFTHNDKTKNFTHWNTKPDDSGQRYANKARVENLTDGKDATVTLYAQWGERVYWVTFKPNGASGKEYNQRIVVDTKTPLADCEFTRTGYQFIGWATTPDATTAEYANQQEVSNLTEESEEIALYAVWREHSYTLMFDAGNGYGDMREQTMKLAYDEEGTLPANRFYLTGHTFAGWAEKGIFIPQYADMAKVSRLSAVDNDLVYLYALWTPNNYTLHFDGNNAETGEMSDMPMIYGVKKSLALNSFQRTGYSFIGWDTLQVTDKEPLYTDGKEVNNVTSVPDTTINLYAQWREHRYKVTFSANNEYAQGVMNDFEVGYDEKTTLPGNTFINVGHNFIGWATSAGGDRVYINQAEIHQLTPTDNGTVNLFALWAPNTYTIRFNANGGSETMDDMRFYFGGEPQPLTSNAFTRTGYTFTGWNTASDGSGADFATDSVIHNLTAVPNAVITLYAQWRAHTYTVSFNANGADGSMPDMPLVYDGVKTALAANAFTRTGYTFTGWNTAANGTGTPHADRDSVLNWTAADNAVITLHAQWRAHTYTVMYVPNGGEGDMPNHPFVYGEQQTLKANTYTRTGYTFAGWNTAIDGSGKAYADGSTVSNLTAKDGDFVGLFAQWTPEQYTITFLNDDGTELQSGKWNYDATPVYTGATPAKASTAEFEYTFTGWSPVVGVVKGDATYTAQFRAARRSYVVTFVSEGVTLQTEVMEYGEMPYYSGDDPEKPATVEAKYRFKGWTPELTAVVADATYTALFEEIVETGVDNAQAARMTLYVDGRTINITGLPADAEVAVFDTNGKCIYRGTGRLVPVTAPGVYIVRSATETQKTAVR